MPTPDDPYLSAKICWQKANECIELAGRMKDPDHIRAMLLFAEWWMRLAQYDPIVGMSKPESPDRVKIQSEDT
jgi:hypothetical protein